MESDHAGPSRFLAEWYTPGFHGRRIADVATCLRRCLRTTTGPALLYAVEIPADAYAFDVFTADSVDAVVDLCRDAGLPADRVSAAVEAPAESVSEHPISHGIDPR